MRDTLAQANYTDAGILKALAITELSTPRASDLAPWLRRTRCGTRLDTLIRLLLIGVPVEVEAVRRAVHPMRLESWVEAGLLALSNDSAFALVKLLPYQGLILAFDAPRELEHGARADFVMGIGSSTLTLANVTMRRPSRRTLDLGTGCGIQAFLAAPHSEQVVAIDRNPRASRFVAFNARLNGLDNVTCGTGDLFEPVQGQQFDLIISNPPYVISPVARYLYRDSGMQGDQFCQRIVQEVPRYLNEGGYFHMICNWANYAGQDWQERLATWVAGTGCDAWVMRSETWDASTYATVWIRHTEEDSPTRFAALYEDWMRYYEGEGIESMSAGLITLRRTSTRPNWWRADNAPAKMLGPCGEAIRHGFELRDFLETVQDDRALLAVPLMVSPDVRWEQHCEPAQQRWQVVTSHLRLAQGLVYTGDIDPYVASLVVRCDGQQTLGNLLAEFAAALEVERDTIIPACLDVVRRLIERGFLLPPGVAVPAPALPT
jgi:hypothetical protein